MISMSEKPLSLGHDHRLSVCSNKRILTDVVRTIILNKRGLKVSTSCNFLSLMNLQSNNNKGNEVRCNGLDSDCLGMPLVRDLADLLFTL